MSDFVEAIVEGIVENAVEAVLEPIFDAVVDNVVSPAFEAGAQGVRDLYDSLANESVSRQAR